MSVDDPARFFDAIAGRYDRVYALPAAESRRRMIRILRELPPAPVRVLDLGVGPGRELTALLDRGYEPTGLDVSPRMLAICARRARRIPLVLANFWQPPLPFADATFGAAIALHGTLAHLPSEATVTGFVRELGRVIVRGGRFLAEVPTIAWLDAASSVPPTDERRVTRTGTQTCLFEDAVARTSIETRLLEASEWRETFSPLWEARLEAMSPIEWLIVAERL